MAFQKIEPTEEMKILLDIVGRAIQSVNHIFDPHPAVFAAVLGQVAGEFLSCCDNCYEEAIPDYKERYLSCVDTFQANFQDAKETHDKIHKDRAASVETTNNFVNSVCESHKNPKR